YLPRSGQGGDAAAPAPQGALAYADPAPVAAPAAAHQPSGGYHLASASSAPERRAEPHRPANPRTVLNDAQIASIKERLHLTPSQERMWPAVAAALRGL